MLAATVARVSAAVSSSAPAVAGKGTAAIGAAAGGALRPMRKMLITPASVRTPRMGMSLFLGTAMCITYRQDSKERSQTR
ncbi:hypothetical protein GY14_26975 [Delftia tsuruhatensis]|nr:hypothetical protein GY14_26975 [Delftia tsuruhatensis]